MRRSHPVSLEWKESLFNRWRKAGIWDRLMDAIIAAHDGKLPTIDSAIVRVQGQSH